MFLYELHFKERYDGFDDLFDRYIYFQSKGLINLYEMGDKIKKIIGRMNDEEDELYEEFSDYCWEEQIDFAFDMVVENEYTDVEKIEMFTALVEI